MPFSISINPQQFVDLESRLRSQVETVLSGSDLKQEIGDYAVESVQYQARVGSPYNSSNGFPSLADSTVKNRRYLAKYNRTHDTFDPEFSNLTVTGQLLDSLTWADAGLGSVVLEFQGDHAPYKGKKGQDIGEALPNATLAQYLAEKGFFVFDTSLESSQQFINRIKTIALGYIRRGLRVQSKLGS